MRMFLQVIEHIPARTVTTFLENLERESAKKIQAAWLGARTRKMMRIWAPEMKKDKAAVIIQRQVSYILLLLFILLILQQEILLFYKSLKIQLISSIVYCKF